MRTMHAARNDRLRPKRSAKAPVGTSNTNTVVR